MNKLKNPGDRKHEVLVTHALVHNKDACVSSSYAYLVLKRC